MNRIGTPQRDRARPAWRSVIDDLGDESAAQLRCQTAGFPDGGRGEHERRVAAVHRRETGKSSQHVGDVRAEDPSEHVQLVDHDETETSQEGRPLAMVGQKAVVEHLGIGQQHVGPVAYPGPLLRRGIAVIGAGHDPIEPRSARQVRDGAELVLGQRLGRKEQERGARSNRLRRRLSDRDLIRQGLARRGAGREHDGLAASDQVDGACLMHIQPAGRDHGRQPLGERSVQHSDPCGSCGLTLDMNESCIGGACVQPRVDRGGAGRRGDDYWFEHIEGDAASLRLRCDGEM